MDEDIEDLTHDFKVLAYRLDEMIKTGKYSPRELSLVRTKVQEAGLWLTLVESKPNHS